jgi:hypothetical protein
MPRRKLSVDIAFADIKKAQDYLKTKDIDVELQVTHPTPKVIKRSTSAYGNVDFNAKKNPSSVVIPLYAKHTIAHAGDKTAGADGKIELTGAGVVTYGPGMTRVPIALERTLLYQDALAQEADRRMLSTERVHKLIVPRQDSAGRQVNVALTVSEDILDAGYMLGDFPGSFIHRAR